MDIIKKHLTNGQYLTTQYEKTSQFLHHTVGLTAMSAWRWWNSTPQRVGTAQIIDRDGSIWECFDPSMWAFHLGIEGDDNWQEKHSINIELVSGGPLRYIDKEFRFYPLWPNKTHYKVIPEDEVYAFTKPWRGFEFWHKYTDDQLESLKWLIGKNTLNFPTLVIDNDIDSIFEFNQKVLDQHIGGIWTHGTVNKHKNDPFPYPPLIEALKEVQDELLQVRKATVIPEVSVKPNNTDNKTSKKLPKSSKGKL